MADLIVRRPPAEVPITPSSNVLFRLGERCNHACPMCTNTGRPELAAVARADVFRRADHLIALGFRRCVLTGGEPTLHPAFFDLVEHLRDRGVVWDLNTHGRAFHRPDFAARARAAGLARAVVSLHSHRPEISRAMSGAPAVAFAQTVKGVRHLVASGVAVTLNLVLSTWMRGQLDAYLTFCASTFGPQVGVKLCFPSLESKGRDWGPVQLRYDDVRAEVRALAPRARALGVALSWESFPNCVTGDPSLENTGRLGFGETHYLDDAGGVRVLAIAKLEAALARFARACADCAAFDRCSGVGARYAERFGVGELTPFPAPRPPWWAAPR